MDRVKGIERPAVHEDDVEVAGQGELGELVRIERLVQAHLDVGERGAERRTSGGSRRAEAL